MVRRIVTVLALVGAAGCNQSSSEYRPLDKAALRSASDPANSSENTDSGKAGTETAETPPGTTRPGKTDPGTTEPGAGEPGKIEPERMARGQETASGESVTGDSESLTVAEVFPVSALAPVNVVDGASVASLLNVKPGSTGPRGLDPAAPASVPATTAVKTHKVELLIPQKTFPRDAQSKALRVSYDDLDLLKVLNMEPVTANAVELMPEWLKGLDGQQIKIRGFMYPTFEAEGIERFVLARDNQICCFGRDPKIYDLIQIEMRPGKVTDYIPPTRSFDVVGRFRIELSADDDKPNALYFVDNAEIITR